MFDEEPSGDIHGECAAEITALKRNAAIWKRLAEYYYGLHQYPSNMDLAQGALDALAVKHGLRQC